MPTNTAVYIVYMQLLGRVLNQSCLGMPSITAAVSYAYSQWLGYSCLYSIYAADRMCPQSELLGYAFNHSCKVICLFTVAGICLQTQLLGYGSKHSCKDLNHSCQGISTITAARICLKSQLQGYPFIHSFLNMPA